MSAESIAADYLVVPVTATNAPQFVEYCRRFGPEHDDSYLPGPEFVPGPDDPSYLLCGADGLVLGAASLLLHSALRRAGKTRFRILHAQSATQEHYAPLVEAVRPHAKGLHSAYLFVPEELAEVRRVLERLGFSIERYSWLLARPAQGVPAPVFPEGFELRRFRPGADDLVWCGLTNLNFADLKGHLTLTPDRLARWFGEEEHLDEGMLILWRDELPAGTLRVIRGEKPGTAELTAISVLPGLRGQGLGRNLVRAGVAVGRRYGLEQATLSVNAENSGAVELYLSEGFERVQVKVCYSQRLG